MATAEYENHSDADLRRGIATAAAQDRRIAREQSDEALAAERRQRDGMAEELERRRKRSPAAWARTVASGGLALAAAGLSVGAKVTGQLAQTLRPAAPEDIPARTQPARPQAQERPRTQPRAPEGATVEQPLPGRDTRVPANEAAPEPAEEPSTHRRSADSHVAELAQATAPDVIAAIEDLSTDELRLLYDEERSHKNRKTVLAAIERAAAPPASERVYSS